MKNSDQTVIGSGIEGCRLTRDVNFAIYDASREKQRCLRAAFHEALSLPLGEQQNERLRQLIRDAEDCKDVR